MQNGKTATTEFVNAEIITKSAIFVEEMMVERSIENEWKTMNDLLAERKFHVKNQPDVTISPGVPVLVTSNNDPYEIFSKSDRIDDRKAARRRTGIVNFAHNWQHQVENCCRNLNQHQVEVPPGTATYRMGSEDEPFPNYSQWWTQHMTHGGQSRDPVLFNTIIGYAILFDMSLASPFQINQYYRHCLKQVLQTTFGMTVANNLSEFRQLVHQLKDVYNAKTRPE